MQSLTSCFLADSTQVLAIFRHDLAKRRNTQTIISKVKQKRTNWNPKGTKSEPKGNQNASIFREHVLGGASLRKGYHFDAILSISRPILAAPRMQRVNPLGVFSTFSARSPKLEKACFL